MYRNRSGSCVIQGNSGLVQRRAALSVDVLLAEGSRQQGQSGLPAAWNERCFGQQIFGMFSKDGRGERAGAVPAIGAAGQFV
jgi:hypothetical protein